MISYDSQSRISYRYEDGLFHASYGVDLPDSAAVSENALEDSLWGSRWLAGLTVETYHIWSDGEKTSLFVCDGKKIYSTADTKVPNTMPIVVFGPIAKMPDKLREICLYYPSHFVYVCPLVEELPAFGMLVRQLNEKPRRALLHNFFDEEIEQAEYQEFDDNLEGDGFGRMAALVAKGIPVLNQMATVAGVCPFYGRLIMKEAHPEAPMYFVHCRAIEHYFSTEPCSAKLFACPTAPVLMKVTDEFRKVSGEKGEFVPVMVASDYVNGLMSFMNFYGAMTKRDWFAICPHNLVKSRIVPPVFRYNRGYRLDLEQYNRVIECYQTFTTPKEFPIKTELSSKKTS